MAKPPEIAEDAPGINLWRSYRYLKSYQHFPRSGGTMEQTAKFLAAVDYCDRVNVTYSKRKQEVEANKEKAMNAIAEMLGERHG